MRDEKKKYYENTRRMYRRVVLATEAHTSTRYTSKQQQHQNRTKNERNKTEEKKNSRNMCI